ncbi:MAG: WG repeat-containing protein [Bacteroidia bacterium]|nr:WG repeat-containing protein [Bacteroidia bacterium]
MKFCRQIFPLILLLSTFQLSFGQGFSKDKKTEQYVFVDKEGKEDKTKVFDDVREFTETMAAVKSKRKWRILDEDGQFQGAPIYDDIRPWFGDYAIFKKGENYGVMDTNLKEIIKPKYEYIDFYHPDSSLVRIDGQWGLLRNNEFMPTSTPEYFRNPEIPIKVKGCKSNNWQCLNQTLIRMIQKDMLYPQEAILNKVEGRVVADVYLDEEGGVDDVVLVKGIGAGCEEEAIWAMKYYIEDIQPAKFMDAPTKSIRRQTISFQLTEKTKKAVNKYQKQKAKMVERRQQAKAKEKEEREERAREIEAKKEKEAEKERKKNQDKKKNQNLKIQQ